MAKISLISWRRGEQKFPETEAQQRARARERSTDSGWPCSRVDRLDVLTLGHIYEEIGKWSEAVLAFQKSAELDMFRPEAHLNLARALYYQHRAELGPDLLQPLLERLQMVLCFTPDDEAGHDVRQRIEMFLDFLTSAL
jgi:hypothetical protein